jgi:hypothetical protein
VIGIGLQSHSGNAPATRIGGKHEPAEDRHGGTLGRRKPDVN